MTKTEIIQKLRDVKLLALDFDGIMTNGMVYTDQDGRETVLCSRKDGLGVDMLKRHGIKIYVISKETNRVVAARCKKLRIPHVQAIKDSEGKLEILQRLAHDAGFVQHQIVYMGDDLNDVAPLKWAGVGITVSDAHSYIRTIANYITEARGGDHAIREVAELLLRARDVKLDEF